MESFKCKSIKIGKITYVKGDLVKAAKEGKAPVIAHQCNCFCTMGAGIAPIIAEAFPSVKEADNETEKGNPYKLGTFSKAVEQGVTIYNIYGQFHWAKFKVADGRNTDYNALSKGFVNVAEDMIDKGYETIYLPKIGCGLAGGDWRLVEVMLKETFTKRELNVIVYEL